MGKTAFSGPVYGSKGLLWAYTGNLSTGGSTALVTSRMIPTYEDWYITEVYAKYNSTTSSGGFNIIVKSEGGSTTGIVRQTGGLASTVAQTIATLTKGTSTTADSTLVTTTPTAGEYEGLYVPAGSTMRIVSSGVDAVPVSLSIMGFIRWVASTRAV